MDHEPGLGARLGTLYRKHTRFLYAILILAILYVALASAGTVYRPLSPDVLLSKESADTAKEYILGFGEAAPLLFIAIQVAQVVVAPIPGQAAGFAGGYVFGWRLGVLYTMIGLATGSWLVFLLSRKLGRRFVEKLNGAEALKDFEALFRAKDGGFYGKSKDAVRSHGLLTFFLIMLLPALPDDLVCFAAGLSRIPIWKLMIAALLGRFPGMLALSMAGDGFSNADSNTVFVFLIGACVALSVLYLWKRESIEKLMRKAAGVDVTTR
jgi:uncharacterized membrane protein YdjX (TVP38/TMEM64 family)